MFDVNIQPVPKAPVMALANLLCLISHFSEAIQKPLLGLMQSILLPYCVVVLFGSVGVRRTLSDIRPLPRRIHSTL